MYIFKAFNFISNSDNFPAIWNESIVVLLHKSGINKLDPSKYRGISVTSDF